MSSYMSDVKYRANLEYVEGEMGLLKEPKIELTQSIEDYHPQTLFSHSETETKLTHPDGSSTIYRIEEYAALEVLKEDGTKVWIDGRCAPYSNSLKGKYTNNYVSVTTHVTISLDEEGVEVFRQSGDYVEEKDIKVLHYKDITDLIIPREDVKVDEDSLPF